MAAGYVKFNPLTAVHGSDLAFALNLMRPLFEHVAGDASERRGEMALVMLCWDPAAAPGTYLHLDWLRAENVAVALDTGGASKRTVRWRPGHAPVPASVQVTRAQACRAPRPPRSGCPPRPLQWTTPTDPLAVWMFIAPWAMKEADEAAPCNQLHHVCQGCYREASNNRGRRRS